MVSFSLLRRGLAALSLLSLWLVAACGGEPAVPTGVPTATAPAVAPTNTPAPVPTNTPQPAAPTNTPAPPPTNTPQPALPTATSMPAPTNIPARPTTTPAPAAGGWEHVNPAVVDGRAPLVSDPRGPGPIYAGGTGVSRSTDGGRTWAVLKAGIPVDTLAVAPSDPRVIYAGEGEGCARGNEGTLYRSGDSGATWRQVAGAPYALSVDPAAANHVLGLRCDGVYETTDGAATWNKRAAPVDTNFDGLRLVRGVNNPAVLYALFTSEGGGPALARSADAGRTWQPFAAGDMEIVIDLAVDPKDARHVYATGFSGFFSSANSGATWNAHNGGLAKGPDFYELSNVVLDTVSTPPRGATATLYLGDTAGVRRWNGNDAWVLVASAPGNGQAIRRLLMVNDPAQPAVIALTDTGLYRLLIGRD